MKPTPSFHRDPLDAKERPRGNLYLRRLRRAHRRMNFILRTDTLSVATSGTILIGPFQTSFLGSGDRASENVLFMGFEDVFVGTLLSVHAKGFGRRKHHKWFSRRQLATFVCREQIPNERILRRLGRRCVCLFARAPKPTTPN